MATGAGDGDACCPPPGGEEAGLDALEAEMLAEMEADPTLSSCCLRDLRNQRKGNAIRAQLLAMDISTARLKAYAGAVPEDPKPAESGG